VHLQTVVARALLIPTVTFSARLDYNKESAGTTHPGAFLLTAFVGVPCRCPLPRAATSTRLLHRNRTPDCAPPPERPHSPIYRHGSLAPAGLQSCWALSFPKAICIRPSSKPYIGRQPSLLLVHGRTRREFTTHTHW